MSALGSRRAVGGWRPVAILLTSTAFASLAFGCEGAPEASVDDPADEASEGDLDSAEARRRTLPWWLRRRDGGAATPTRPGKDAGVGTTDPGPVDPGPGHTPGGHGGSDSLWCNAKAVFDQTCSACHGSTTAAGAPMPLATYEDFQKEAPLTPGKKVWEVSHARVHDSARPMPPGRPLKPEQLAAIDAWVKDGAKPGSDATCAGNEPAEPKPEVQWPPPGSECYRLTVDNDGKGKKQVVAANDEPHPQVILDAPWGDQDVQAVGFRPITDNPKVLHHWILYQAKGFAFITGWAPGQDDSKMKAYPPDVGVFLPKGKQSLRLDMHYNNKAPGAKQEQDASGVEVCVTKPRKFAATTFMQFVGFKLPMISKTQKEADVIGTCKVKVTQPVYLLSQSPHAHEFTKHAKFEVQRDGKTITLHDAPFDFNEQHATPFDPPFELKNGDVVKTTCHLVNNPNNPQDVTFGENTGNEMCFNFAQYYPMGALSCEGSLGGLLGGLGGGAR